MVNFDDVVKENIKEHDPNWSRQNICKWTLWIRKKKFTIHLKNQQPDMDKILFIRFI